MRALISDMQARIFCGMSKEVLREWSELQAGFKFS